MKSRKNEKKDVTLPLKKTDVSTNNIPTNNSGGATFIEPGYISVFSEDDLNTFYDTDNPDSCNNVI